MIWSEVGKKENHVFDDTKKHFEEFANPTTWGSEHGERFGRWLLSRQSQFESKYEQSKFDIFDMFAAGENFHD